MLTIQMVRIMDKLWLREGIDLKMVTFSCVPTGHKRGTQLIAVSYPEMR
jgi:phosphatidylinositol-4-phosphate 3-kinase